MTNQSSTSVLDKFTEGHERIKGWLQSAIHYAVKSADSDPEEIKYGYDLIVFKTTSQMTEFEVDVYLEITSVADEFQNAIDAVAIDYIKTFPHTSVQYDQNEGVFIFTTARL